MNQTKFLKTVFFSNNNEKRMNNFQNVVKSDNVDFKQFPLQQLQTPYQSIYICLYSICYTFVSACYKEDMIRSNSSSPNFMPNFKLTTQFSIFISGKEDGRKGLVSLSVQSFCRFLIHGNLERSLHPSRKTGSISPILAEKGMNI